jgi:hypothetical protein
MAIDFEAIRKKLNKLSGNSSKRDILWRPQEGEEATVRLLSFPNNDGQPFKELWFYYNVGNSPGLLAPYQFSRPDPIQELINKLRDDGTKESYELAKKLYPKMRAYAAVVVRGEEDKGVRLWSFGKQVYQALLNVMLDEDYGDITDPKTGRDVKVTCSKANGKTYASTDVMPRGKSSPLSESPERAKQWLSSVPDVSELYTEKSYQELEKIVNDWLNGDSDSAPATSNMGTTRGESRAAAPTAAPAVADDGDEEESPKAAAKGKAGPKYKNIDDAFADLEDV